MEYDPLNSDSDPFGPPAISTVVHCIHCGEEYDSYKIEWRIERDADGKEHGFWCCPMEDCDGKGFGFDIFPVDPEYRDENGELMWCSDEDEDDDDLDNFDDDESDFLDFEDDDEGDDEMDLLPDDEAPLRGPRLDGDEDIPF